MPGTEAEEILALALIFVVHLAGGLMLVWGMLDSRPGRWRRWGRGGGPDEPGDAPRPPSPPRVRAPLPLPVTDPSNVRLRDETPLRESYPALPRRPQRVPEREPSRR